MIYQSFYWNITQTEAEYLFHIIHIAFECGCKFAVYDESNVTSENTAKFAVEAPELKAIARFREHSKNRMFFHTWDSIEPSEFLGAKWIFTDNQDNSKSVLGIISLMRQSIEYSSHPFSNIEVILLPYNIDMNNPRIDYLLRDVLLNYNPPIGRSPSLIEIKEVINEVFSENSEITYFQSGAYWDARISNPSGEMNIQVSSDYEGDKNYHVISFRGEMELIKKFTQQITNLCGTMILDRLNEQPIIIEAMLDS